MKMGGFGKSRKIRFGPGDTLGGTAPLIMLGKIDAYEPRRRRARRGRGLGLVMLVAAAAIIGMVLFDAARRGDLLPFLT